MTRLACPSDRGRPGSAGTFKLGTKVPLELGKTSRPISALVKAGNSAHGPEKRADGIPVSRRARRSGSALASKLGTEVPFEAGKTSEPKSAVLTAVKSCTAQKTVRAGNFRFRFEKSKVSENRLRCPVEASERQLLSEFEHCRTSGSEAIKVPPTGTKRLLEV